MNPFARHILALADRIERSQKTCPQCGGKYPGTDEYRRCAKCRNAQALDAVRKRARTIRAAYARKGEGVGGDDDGEI